MRVRTLRAITLPFLVLALAGCGGSTSDNGGGGGGGTPGATTVPSGAVEIKIVADPTNVGAFQPATATAKVSQPVAWSFDDADNAHTVTAEDGGWDSQQQTKGFIFVHTFDAAGTFKYHCTLHANMTGEVTVTQ